MNETEHNDPVARDSSNCSRRHSPFSRRHHNVPTSQTHPRPLPIAQLQLWTGARWLQLDSLPELQLWSRACNPSISQRYIQFESFNMHAFDFDSRSATRSVIERHVIMCEEEI